MDMERSFLAGTRETGNRGRGYHDLSPAQAGLSAALRRAFAPPEGAAERQFEELLRKLC